MSQIRLSQEREKIFIKGEMQKFLLNRCKHIEKNRKKYHKVFLKAEMSKKRKIRLWTNRFLIKPKYIGKASADELMDMIEEIVEEEGLCDRLSDVFDYDVWVEWSWVPNLLKVEGRTAPSKIYLKINIAWSTSPQEDGEEEGEGDTEETIE